MIFEKTKGLLDDQGTYNVFTNVKQLPSNSPADKLTEDEQQFILKELGRVF